MRKFYIDNIRWTVIILVVIHHVICVFNSTGVIMNFNAPGIPAMDIFAYFVYPWIMPCMFLIAGISARYSLEKRTEKKFAKERIRKLLVPFLFGIVVIAPLTAIITFNSIGLWDDFAEVPKLILYLIMMFSGMGPLWFLLELFVVSMIFIIIKHFDKNDKIWKTGIKANILIIILMFIPIFLSAQVLNFLSVFRNALFLLLFLLGYYVFSHEKIQAEIKRYHIPLLIVALILFILQAFMFWGQNFSEIVNNWIVMLYTWFMVLAVIGSSQVWLNCSNKFTEYMNSRGFLIYILHYLLLNAIAYAITTCWNLPVILNYVLVLVFTAIATFALSEVVYRIPGFKTLL